jgi:Colicin V production protein.
MTIWIVAVLFVASLIGLGLRQGAIRVAASLVGILLGALLAVPLGNLLKPVFGAIGMKNPALIWLVPPAFVFVLILTLAKVGGLFLHKKVEVFYKYKAGELRLALWERLNSRLGICLGTLNALAYMILLAQAVYMISYWTYQAQTESDPRSVRIVNRLGKDLQSTGMSKVAAAVDSTSPAYYDAADIAGLLYQTPLLEARLSRYPGILALSERQEFKDLASDSEFSAMRQRGASIAEILDYPRVQDMMKNADLMNNIETSLVPNLKDLRAFLETGISEKYSEPILGRWNFDVNGTLGIFRREKPTMTSKEMNQRKAILTSLAAAVEIIATPEGQVIFKNVPLVRATTMRPQTQTVTGDWKGQEGKYTFSVAVEGKTEFLSAEIHGSRLVVNGPDLLGLAFNRED